MTTAGGSGHRGPDLFQQQADEDGDGRQRKFTFAGAEYFVRMQDRNLYTTDREVIRQRVGRLGLAGVFERRHDHRPVIGSDR
ncbi:MAG: hypothetical protein M0Z41_17665 [Peptococcaceae bacterium]|jgi:hypothetical protein|nr:hypothetical protein [Peptococcaceae bacterium]